MVLNMVNYWDVFICCTLYKHLKCVECISKHCVGKAICNTNMLENSIPSFIFYN